MRQIISLIRLYLTWLPMLKWINGLAVLTIIAGLFVSSPNLKLLLLIIGGTIFILIVVFVVNSCFTLITHNRYLGLVPGFRNKAGYALFTLVLACSAAISLLYWLAPPPGLFMHPLRIFFFAFIYISAYFLVSQWIINYFMNRASLFILLPVLIVVYMANLKSTFVYFAKADTISVAILFMATLLLWTILIRLVANLPAIKSLKVASGSWQGKETSLLWKLYYLIVGRSLTAPGTLLRGWPDNWSGRLAGYLLIVHAIPLSMGLLWSLTHWDLKFFNFAYSNFYLVYAVTFILVISKGTSSSEYVRRCRYLWLHSSGDRMGLWHYMEKVFLQDAFIFNTCLITLALLQVMAFSVPANIAAMFILMCITLTLLSIYMGMYVLLAGWSPAGNVLTLISIPLILYLAFSLSVKAGYFLATYIVVILLFAGSAYLFRHLTIKAFRVVDWCALRPIPVRKKLGSMGT